jgi:flavin-dependent dehydrogenase
VVTLVRDVVVLGAGPSGLTTAVCLARAGMDVTVLDRGDFVAPRVGEHLSPEGRGLLVSGQFGFQIDEAGHQRSFGIQAVWGAEVPRHMDYLFHPFGHGLNLSRPRFDAELAQCARRAGIHVLTRQPRAHFARDRSGWVLETGGLELRTRFLVDATGRSAAVARKLGASIHCRDRQVAIVAYCHGSPPDSSASGGTVLIEAVEHGWWYAAPLIDGCCVGMFVTDASLANSARVSALWTASLAQTRHIRPLLEDINADSTMLVRAAGSQRIDRVVGEAWLAVGDAASAFDPLSSQGIVKALRHGSLAAQTITAYLGGDSSVLQEFQSAMDEEFATYQRTRTSYYRLEQRFPHSAFWRTRQQ